MQDLPVAVLYTTRNDFSAAAARTCIDLDYPNHTLYVLDDSTDDSFRAQVDDFAAQHGARVRVVRRPDHAGFKAGNLNHALNTVVNEPLFVVVDADERLPRDFLEQLVPRMSASPRVGFIQANHVCLAEGTQLQRDLHVGVDVHWKWYQPLRNRYGFVMFLGHGAIIRREAWEAVGGFPHVVSEDLAFAIEIRELGFVGEFAEDVCCGEEFPPTVRDFRRRHVKWTRGTAEFLDHYFVRLVRSRKISWTEKLDILFPTVNLPLTFFFFIFLMMAGVVLPIAAGNVQTLTVELGLTSVAVPILRPPAAFDVLHRWDVYLITVATIASPVLSFIIELWRQPVRLVRFLVHSTALYATLAPLSTVAIIGYMTTRQANFLVTGDRSGADDALLRTGDSSPGRVRQFLPTTDPDSSAVRALEVLAGVVLAVGAILTLQFALLGLVFGYILLVYGHRHGWDARGIRKLSSAPTLGICTSTLLTTTSLIGLQPVLFGLAPHF